MKSRGGPCAPGPERFYRPTVNVAAAGRVNQGKFEKVRLAVGCIGPKAQRLWELEKKVEGLAMEEARRLVADSKRHLADQLEPVDDLLGSAATRISLKRRIPMHDQREELTDRREDDR